ncbi:MAG: DNA-directed RNA polymerase subunit alpha C-terminal domain-containing protein [Crinalium sp.]
MDKAKLIREIEQDLGFEQLQTALYLLPDSLAKEVFTNFKTRPDALKWARRYKMSSAQIRSTVRLVSKRLVDAITEFYPKNWATPCDTTFLAQMNVASELVSVSNQEKLKLVECLTTISLQEKRDYIRLVKKNKADLTNPLAKRVEVNIALFLFKQQLTVAEFFQQEKDSLDRLELPSRLSNALRRLRIHKVSELGKLLDDPDYDDVLATQNLGRESMATIKSRYESFVRRA